MSIPFAVVFPGAGRAGRTGGRWIFLAVMCGLVLATICRGASEAANTPSVLIVVGAAGEEEYGHHFAEWAAAWEKACEQAGTPRRTIGVATNPPTPDRVQLQEFLASEPKEGSGELWLVLLGHGTYDGKEAKFNLRGPDVSSTDLGDWLKPFRRPIAVIDAASASAPFINKLSATNRVILVATRSGSEINYARFGKFLSEAIADPAADLDKDGQTSLLEAFLTASRRVGEFYVTEGRMVTEHALLDDNGDGLGTPAEWFRGIRAVKSAKDGALLDGFRAHQFHLVQSDAERKLSPAVRARRDELEMSIAALRKNKAQLAEDDYYQRLEALLLQIARLHQSPDALPAGILALAVNRGAFGLPGLPLNLSSKYQVPGARAEVYASLIDPAVIQAVIDVCEKIVQTGEESYEAHLRIGLGGFKRTCLFQMQITQRRPPRSFTVLIEGRGLPGLVKGRAEVHLSEARGQTEIQCDAEARVGGLIAAIGSRRIEAGARRMMDEFFRKFGEQLTATT